MHNSNGQNSKSSKMKRIFWAAKSRHFRTSTQLGLNVAGALPSSSSVPLDNSEGASRAASELSAALDTAFDQIDFEGSTLTSVAFSLTCVG